MEKTADYLRRGRRFASLTLDEGNELWVTGFADLAKGEMWGRELEIWVTSTPNLGFAKRPRRMLAF